MEKSVRTGSVVRTPQNLDFIFEEIFTRKLPFRCRQIWLLFESDVASFSLGKLQKSILPASKRCFLVKVSLGGILGRKDAKFSSKFRALKVEKILKGSLDWIPSPSVKIQIMGANNVYVHKRKILYIKTITNLILVISLLYQQ